MLSLHREKGNPLHSRPGRGPGSAGSSVQTGPRGGAGRNTRNPVTHLQAVLLPEASCAPGPLGLRSAGLQRGSRASWSWSLPAPRRHPPRDPRPAGHAGAGGGGAQRHQRATLPARGPNSAAAGKVPSPGLRPRPRAGSRGRSPRPGAGSARPAAARARLPGGSGRRPPGLEGTAGAGRGEVCGPQPGRGAQAGPAAARSLAAPPPPPPLPGSAILIPAPALLPRLRPSSAPSAARPPPPAPPAPHLGDGLPVAGHRLLDEAENFHVAVPARHDHPGPPEAHGHFHAAAAAAAAGRPAPLGDRGRRARSALGRGDCTRGARRAARGARLGAAAGGPIGSHARPVALAAPSPAWPRARPPVPARRRSLRPPVRCVSSRSAAGPCGAGAALAPGRGGGDAARGGTGRRRGEGRGGEGPGGRGRDQTGGRGGEGRGAAGPQHPAHAETWRGARGGLPPPPPRKPGRRSPRPPPPAPRFLCRCGSPSWRWRGPGGIAADSTLPQRSGGRGGWLPPDPPPNSQPPPTPPPEARSEGAALRGVLSPQATTYLEVPLTPL